MYQSDEQQSQDDQTVQTVQRQRGFKSECKDKYPEVDFGPYTKEGLCQMEKGWINALIPKNSAYNMEEKTINLGKKAITNYEHCRKLIYDTNESSIKPKLQKLQRIMPYFGYEKVKQAKGEKKARGGKTKDKPEKLWIKDGVQVSLTNEQVREIIHQGIMNEPEYRELVYINDRCFAGNQIIKSYAEIYDEIYDKFKANQRAARKRKRPTKTIPSSPPSRPSPGPLGELTVFDAKKNYLRSIDDDLPDFDKLLLVMDLVHSIANIEDVKKQLNLEPYELQAIRTYVQFAKGKKKEYVSGLEQLHITKDVIDSLVELTTMWYKNNIITPDKLNDHIDTENLDVKKKIIGLTMNYLKIYKLPGQGAQQYQQAQGAQQYQQAQGAQQYQQAQGAQQYQQAQGRQQYQQ